MVSFPYYSHTTPIRIPKDMGIVWETYHKGVPLLGVPENTLDDCAGGVLPNSTYQPTNLCVFYNKVSTRWFGGFCPSAVFLPSLNQFDPVGSTVFGRFLIHLPYQGLLRRTCLSRRGLTGLVDKLECRS